MDLRALMSRRPDWWYDKTVPPYAQRSEQSGTVETLGQLEQRGAEFGYGGRALRECVSDHPDQSAADRTCLVMNMRGSFYGLAAGLNTSVSG